MFFIDYDKMPIYFDGGDIRTVCCECGREVCVDILEMARRYKDFTLEHSRVICKWCQAGDKGAGKYPSV